MGVGAKKGGKGAKPKKKTKGGKGGGKKAKDNKDEDDDENIELKKDQEAVKEDKHWAGFKTGGSKSRLEVFMELVHNHILRKIDDVTMDTLVGDFD